MLWARLRFVDASGFAGRIFLVGFRERVVVTIYRTKPVPRSDYSLAPLVCSVEKLIETIRARAANAGFDHRKNRK